MTQIKEKDYEEFKKASLNNEPIQKKVALSQIEVAENGTLIVAGTPVRSSENVVEKDLLQTILKLRPDLLTTFEKGDLSKKDLINMVKSALALSNVKKSQITIVGSPLSGNVFSILPGNKDIISNKLAFDLFEKSIERSGKGTKIVSMTSNENGGFSINVKKEVVIDKSILSTLSVGEEFNPGFSFTSSPLLGIALRSYIERLVCTNGMSHTIERGGKFNISRLTDNIVLKFLEQFSQLSSNNFVNSAYAEQINKAASTPISFGEILTARKILTSHSKLRDTDINSYLPEFSTVDKLLTAKGVNFEECKPVQLKNYSTPYNVWEVVNRLTDFGSHNYGYDAEYSKIQTAAGALFNKKRYDTQNLILF